MRAALINLGWLSIGNLYQSEYTLDLMKMRSTYDTTTA